MLKVEVEDAGSSDRSGVSGGGSGGNGGGREGGGTGRGEIDGDGALGRSGGERRSAAARVAAAEYLLYQLCMAAPSVFTDHVGSETKRCVCGGGALVGHLISGG